MTAIPDIVRNMEAYFDEEEGTPKSKIFFL